MQKKVVFIIPPTVELLDLAGPVQVFTEAKFYGFDIDIEFYSYQKNIISTAGIAFKEVDNYENARMKEGDFLFIPGMDFEYVSNKVFRQERAYFEWIKKCSAEKINVCSVCNGAFALGEAGLLDNIKCTTHWRRIKALQNRFPAAKVMSDIFFIKHDNIYTSAGMSTGIDLALSILRELQGELFMHKVLRGLEVFYRHNNVRQQTIYLRYRNHIDNRIHSIQDYLINNLSGETNIKELAQLSAMSSRNLSRLFKAVTGVTILDYITQLRLQNAKTLLKNPDISLENVATACGFKTIRQLQRILKK